MKATQETCSTVNYPELGDASQSLITLERVGSKFQAIWETCNDEQAVAIMKQLKIRASRVQHCEANDWSFDTVRLRKVNTVFWVITPNAADKLIKNNQVSMSILLD